jgi:arsenate reductase (thioredoxin)
MGRIEFDRRPRISEADWWLPDPAGTAGPEAERLESFRQVRDELRRRLAVGFAR